MAELKEESEGILGGEFKAVLCREGDPSSEPASHGQKGVERRAREKSAGNRRRRSESNRSELGLEIDGVTESITHIERLLFALPSLSAKAYLVPARRVATNWISKRRKNI